MILPRGGRSRCAVCNAKHKRPPRKQRTEEQRQEDNANKREWARMRKKAHLCVYCGAQDKRTLNGASSCLVCATKRSKKRRETWDYNHQKELRDARKQRWREAGLCSECGGEKEEPEKAMCIDCRVRHKMRKAKWKVNHGWLPRGANGICFQCNRVPAMEGKKLCPECYRKKVETLRENSKNRWKGKEQADN